MRRPYSQGGKDDDHSYEKDKTNPAPHVTFDTDYTDFMHDGWMHRWGDLFKMLEVLTGFMTLPKRWLISMEPSTTTMQP